MRKKLFIALAIITGLVISLACCILGEDIDTLEKEATKDNIGITVDIPGIAGVTVPINAQTPVTSITETEQYTGTVSWTANNRSLNADERFLLGTQYTATITLTPKTKYTLHMVGANFFTVAGATSAVNKKNSGVITAVFPPAVEGIVNIAAVPVAVPVPGGTPTATVENDMYTGTVTWSPAVSGTFDTETLYTATITLTVKTGFTLQGVGANSFTVTGATSVSNAANSGVITAIFPTTSAGITPGRIEYYWVDQHGSLVTTSDGSASIVTGTTLTITPAPQAQGYVVKKWYVNGVDTGQSSDTYIFSITTVGKHTVDLFLEKDSKLYSTGITIEVLSNVLTANMWTKGNIAASTGEQWFKFTATANTQYIHFTLGTLNDLKFQLYDSAGTAVGIQHTINSGKTYDSQTVTSGQTYYIKVTPYISGGSGTYQITFSESATTPPQPVVLPSEAVTLTADTWANGKIAVSGGSEWFKFTATSNTQYIHAYLGMVSSISVQVYNSTGYTVGSQTSLSSGTTNTSRTLTSGQTYYIKVTPSGTSPYKIAFNTSSTSPSILPSDATALTAATWTDGSITVAGDEQWFKFTATASRQYIHVTFGTLTSLNIQVYDSTGSTVGSQTNLISSTTNTSRTVTSGQTYYILVTPYSSAASGTYKIAFNASSTPPLPDSAASATALTAATWTDGSITVAGGEQWFKFTATANTQYIHVTFGTLTSLNIQVYDSTGSTVGSQTSLISSTYTSRTVISGQTYYIKVSPLGSGTGTFRIAYNTSSSRPNY